jgi:hypothetical protein
MIPGRSTLGTPVTNAQTTDDLVAAEAVDVPGILLSRYQQDIFYTKLGSKIMLSLNFPDAARSKSQESLSKSYAVAAKGLEVMSLPPHISQLSSSAYIHLVKDGVDQAIILL